MIRVLTLAALAGAIGCAGPDSVVEGGEDTLASGADAADVAGVDDAGADGVSAADAADPDGAGSDSVGTDAAATDGGSTDAAQGDAGPVDAGPVDGGDLDSDSAGDDAASGDATPGDASTSDGSSTDAGTTDAGTTDTGPVTCPGGPGCACAADKDCGTGLCATQPGGAKACAQPCDKGACAKGTTCEDVAGKKLCVVADLAFCSPCTSDTDCQVPGAGDAACVQQGGAGAFCGVSCAVDADCPAESTCQESEGSSGSQSKQCVPKTPLACACSPWALSKFAKTSCYAAGAPGCTATVTCLPDGAPGAPKGGGLTACAPPKAATETCDGVDQDCDGDVDNGAVCDDDNPCTDDSCDGKKGCAYVANQAPCEDGDKCTDKDTCSNGKCSAGAATQCDDGNPCTKDTCDAKAGCQATEQTGKCDDGDKCTETDTCDKGACTGKKLVCDDGNPCTTDTCDVTKGCVFKAADGKACDDGDACTDKDLCGGTKCVPGKAKVCDDGNPCTKDSCDDKTGCVNAAVTGACDDGSACTSKDTCAQGKCVGQQTVCDDGNPCTTDNCDPKQGCLFKPADKAACDDGDKCTAPDVCVGAKCGAGPKVVCDDKDKCTTDSCDPKVGCVHKAIAGCGSTKTLLSTDFTCGANDLSAWTFTGTGNVSFAVDASPNTPGFHSKPCSLNANNGKDYQCPANAKKIEATAVSPLLDGGKFVGTLLGVRMHIAGTWQASTDDNLDLEVSADGKTWSKLATFDGTGNTFEQVTVAMPQWKGKKFRVRLRFWTTDCLFNTGTGPFVDDLSVGDVACTSDAVCPKGKPCQLPVCDLQAGTCGFKPATDGAKCDDDNACTATSSCKQGTCTGTLKVCDDNDWCTNDFCDPKTGQCATTAKADGSFCADGSSCTKDDACKGGKCVGVVNNDGGSCSDGNLCTVGEKCQSGKCVGGANRPDGYSCSDASSCTVGDACKSGQCVGGTGSPCDDNNPCTLDACTKKTSYSHTCTSKPVADGGACDDGDACTTGESCAAGVCKAKATLCGETKLLDAAFPCGSKLPGWTLEPKEPEPKVGWHVDATANVPGYKSAKCSLNLNNGKDFAAGRVVARVVTPPRALPAGSRVTLSWYSYHDMETSSNYDKRWVVLSVGGTPVRTWREDNTKGSKTWTLRKLDLSRWAGQTVTVSWVFDSRDGVNNSGKGWFLDDVLLVAKKVNAPCVDKANCDDGNTCTTDACTAGKCVNTAVKDGTACNDGSACTTTDSCAKGECTGKAKTCADTSDCTQNLCESAKATCAYVPWAVGTQCGGDPGLCAKSSACSLTGVCSQVGSVVCDDKKPCTKDSCDPKTGKCVFVPQAAGAACSDGSSCTYSDKCQTDGSCVGTAKVCNDQDGCTVDSCTATTGACTYKPVADCGSKPLPMPFKESFKTGSASAKLWQLTGTPNGPGWAIDATPYYPTFKSSPTALNFNDGVDYDCPGGKPLSATVGVEGVAQFPDIDFTSALKPSLSFWLSGTWEPGDWDNLDLEASVDGGKSWLKLKTYPAGTSKYSFKQVTTDLAPLAGKQAKLRFRFWTKSCDKNTGYTGPDIDDLVVEDTACKSDAACDDGKPCTKDTCNVKSGDCTNAVTDKAPCDDGDACTLSDVCAQDVCKGTPKDCDDGDACTLFDQCIAGTCSSAAKRSCDDGNPCTSDDCDTKTGTCKNPELATCAVSCLVDDNCSDNNPCTADTCQSGKCVFTAGNDGDVCGLGQRCSKGACAASTKGWARRVIASTSNGSHLCALRTNGQVACWGRNYDGELGRGTVGGRYNAPQTVVGLTNAVSVGAGYMHTCAVRSDGTVWCWGKNHMGQLGDGTETKSGKPVQVKGVSTATAVAAARDATCVLLANSTVTCWGSNLYGLLGQGKTTSVLSKSATPLQVPGLANVRTLTSGGYNMCALRSDGGLWCWGSNSTRQTATQYGDKTSPTKKSEMPAAVGVANASYATLGILADGTVRTFGRGYYGELGDGTKSSASQTSVKVPKVTGVRAVGRHQYGFCAIDKAGAPSCWGRNSYGELSGDGSKSEVLSPAAVQGVGSVIDGAGTYNAFCFVTQAGSVMCAGYNYYGQLANGSFATPSKPKFSKVPGT